MKIFKCRFVNNVDFLKGYGGYYGGGHYGGGHVVRYVSHGGFGHGYHGHYHHVGKLS